VQLQERYPDQSDGESARDGNTAHSLAKGALEYGFTDVRLYHESGLFTGGSVDDDMLSAVQMYIDAVMTGHGRMASKLRVEERVDCSAIHRDCWGTPDAWYYDSREDSYHVYDLKYGWGLVDVTRNWQLMLYAIGLLSSSSAGGSVHLTIVQPRPWHPDGPVRTWMLSRDQLMGYADHARSSAIAALSDLPLCTTGAWCKHCSALVQCHAAQRMWPTILDLSESISADITHPDQLAFELRLLRRAEEAIKHRLSAVESTAIVLITEGREIPGWQLGRTAGKTVWTAGPDDIRALAGMYGAVVDKPPELVTPTQAIKAGLPKELVAEYTEKKPGAVRLEPINPDKPTAKEIFENAEG